MKEKLKIKKFVIGPIQTNCYLIYGEKSLKGALIDPGAYSEEIDKYIKELKLDMQFILNTHGHADHISGNSFYNLPIYIHEADEACLSDSDKNLSYFSGENIKPMKAEKLLKDADVVSLGDISLEIIYTPGHTLGGISVLAGDVLFSGDTLFFEGIGRTDLPGGSYESLAKSIRERIFTLQDSVKVYPGHGPETTIAHEKKKNPFVK
ncbi:MAG: MBL fold metallo-hydrolase [Candidatus Omnitrophica bacterium]|nr:MBL fold metallo-hydrolase [Candidatus Omnitrophota bacterium]